MRAPRSKAARVGLRVGTGVPDRDHHPVPGQVLDRVERAGQLGSDRDLPQGAASRRQELVDDDRVGLAQVLQVVRPAPLRRQVRPLEVGAEDERVALREVGDLGEAVAEAHERVGDEAQHGSRGAAGAVRRESRVDRALRRPSS